MQTFGIWSRYNYYLLIAKNYATYYAHEAVFICFGKKSFTELKLRVLHG